MVAYKLFRLDMIDRPVWMSLSRNFRDRWIEEREFRRQRASDRSGGPDYYQAPPGALRGTRLEAGLPPTGRTTTFRRVPRAGPSISVSYHRKKVRTNCTMGRRRRKARARGRRPRRRSGSGSQVSQHLTEAVRRGQRGEIGSALRLARKAFDAAPSPVARRRASQVLGEALLHTGLAATDPTTALTHLTEALRHDPDSSRLGFYRALALLAVGRTEEGRTALEGSIGATDWEPPMGGGEYARQLARVAAGEAWSAAGLSEAEAADLRSLWDFRPTEARAGQREQPDRASAQTTLFDEPPGPAWRALLALNADPRSAPVAELEEAVAAVPEPARPRLHYYQGVAALRRGEREQAMELWLSAARTEQEMPWLQRNLGALLRKKAIELAQAGQWRDVVQLAARVPPGVEDRILPETAALAHDHLGHEAAQAGRWSDAAGHWREAEKMHPRRALAQNLALAEEALGRWSRAAEAWRAVARRRPRKPDHPDYLSDAEVAALWAHAADCYERSEREERSERDGFNGLYGRYEHSECEAAALTCVETALKYAPDDVELRLKRADLLLARDSVAPAEQELERLLELDPRHTDALRLRANLEDAKPHADGASLWRRLLEIAPSDAEARDSLAESYVARLVSKTAVWWSGAKPRPLREQIRVIEEGLGEVPDHPRLLTVLGQLYRTDEKHEKARETLLRSLDVAPGNANVADTVLHELLHIPSVDEGTIEEVMAHARALPELQPEFWVHQAEQLLACDLPEVWFERFVEEALALAGRPGVPDSRATVLFRAHSIAWEEGSSELAEGLEARIRTEEPASGAVEVIEARRRMEEDDLRGAQRLFRQAERRARRARDSSLQTLIADESMGGGEIGDVFHMFAEMFE